MLLLLKIWNTSIFYSIRHFRKTSNIKIRPRFFISTKMINIWLRKYFKNTGNAKTWKCITKRCSIRSIFDIVRMLMPVSTHFATLHLHIHMMCNKQWILNVKYVRFMCALQVYIIFSSTNTLNTYFRVMNKFTDIVFYMYNISIIPIICFCFQVLKYLTINDIHLQNMDFIMKHHMM